MRRTTTLLWLVSTLLLVVAGGVAGDGDANPKAVVEQPVVDFNLVPKGDKVVHEFKVRNDGNAPLNLTDVHPACGCTVAEFDNVIAPGTVGTIRATLDTVNEAGPIAKSIAVFTNDPENPKLQLVIKATVKPYIAALPGYARFNYVQGEPIGTITQSIWSTDDQPMNVLSVKSPYEYVKVSFRRAGSEELHPKSEGRPNWLVDVTIDPYSPIGALRRYIDVQTDHPKQKLVRIPISGFVRPRQHVTPEQLDFGQLQTDSLPLYRTLAFTNFISRGIEVKDIETGHFALTAEANEIGRKDGHRFQLKFEITAEMPKGTFETTVKIHTTDEKNPLIEVPVKGSVL